ncbi:hypothetical protein GCM10008959_01290 [Deinococcus seoulensis]|uniref:Uncharacterized protein n=1 Tax=Deinococcus seoulensis TaxID=1837379 RepID=A0ABQ2RKE6_9DEIO|nr:hypothetical protein GCM10008959_01290 [Deinococcus seoulensis]
MAPPPNPHPQGGRGSSVALGKSFFRRGVFVLVGDGSGLDAILPPPLQARALRARRPVAVGGQVIGGTVRGADLLFWLQPGAGVV